MKQTIWILIIVSIFNFKQSSIASSEKEDSSRSKILSPSKKQQQLEPKKSQNSRQQERCPLFPRTQGSYTDYLRIQFNLKRNYLHQRLVQSGTQNYETLLTIDTTLSENTTAQGSTDTSAASLTTPHTTIVQNILRSADILVLHPENIPIQQVNMLLNSALMWHMQEEDILNHSKEKLLEFLLKEFGEHTVLDNAQKQQIQKIMGMLPSNITPSEK